MSLHTFALNLQKQYQLKKREIDVVIGYVLGINSAALMIYDKELQQHQKNKIHQFLKKRQQGVPFAYLSGVKDFWSLTLQVNKYTLIPRPETELIIEYVLTKTPTDFDGSILDLGTGTGAIALSLALERPQAKIVAVDKCIECVKTTTVNKQAYQIINTEVLQSNWFEKLKGRTFDFILSNPPYIANDDPHMHDLQFEPRSALVAEDNGYSDLDHIIIQAKDYMNINAELVLEHGYNQAITIKQKLQSNCYINVKLHQDLAGIERITTADVPKSCY